MLSNIARICRNISLIIHYKLMDISNTFVEYIITWMENYKKSLKYIDEPRYIRQDYEDSYDISDYGISPSGGESYLKRKLEEQYDGELNMNRNEWGFPKK